MDHPKLALCLIVKGTDEEARLLARCLDSLHKHVDGIFITRTHKKGEEPNGAIRAVAKAYNATLSDFEWCDDFSAARNFNFSQVTPDYDFIMWSDADDVWRGMEKLRQSLTEHKHMDAFGFWYLYDWDEFNKPTVVHRKTMIVKNDGTAKWVGRLHEDINPTRAYETYLIEGIDRLHLSNEERHIENAKRNVEIAKAELKTNPDDPRSYWNLANSQFGVAEYKASREAFEKFLATSDSDEEKYLAHMRLADVCKASNDSTQAVMNLRYAIGLNPSLPDAYLQLAHLYFEMQNWDKAEEYCLLGLVRKPQIHKMVVFNPRDYDYNPMMMLAQVYYQKNRPDLMLPMLKGCLKIYPDDEKLKRIVKEGEGEYKSMEKALKKAEKLQSITDKKKLKAELDKLPSSIASHPVIAALRNQNFIKETSSGRDLVIYCGNTSHEWNPELFKTKGFGGSEEAIINLSRELAKLRWNVTVYNNCGHKPVTEEVVVYESHYDIPDELIKRGAKYGTKLEKRGTTKLCGRVTYRPFWEWNYRDKQDVTILWRWCKPLDAEINSSKIFVDLHDVVPEGEFTPKRLERISKISVKTNFHRSLFPNVPDEKIAIIPNGMDFALLESNPPIEKDPYLIINTSSPDRSMDVLPKLFKKVKERVPQARLQWAYGWDVYKSAFANDSKKLQWMKDTQAAMDEAGIETLGRLTQAEVGKLYQKASIFAYPTEFAEIDCISVKKAQAAGCFPVTTDFGALNESVQFGMKIPSPKTKDTWNKPYQFHFGLEDEARQAQWIEAVCTRLEIPDAFAHYKPEMRQWAHQFEWPKIAARWHDILCS